MASITNAHKDFYTSIVHAQHVHSDDLCLKRSDATEVCITRDQLAAIAAGASEAAGAPLIAESAGPVALPAPLGSAGATSSTTSATLVVNGNNPATWPLGQSWNDNLGALLTHDGQSETIYSTSTVGITQPGTTTIDYWAHPPAGGPDQWLHATRDIVIQGPANENAATSTPTVANDNTPI